MALTPKRLFLFLSLSLHFYLSSPPLHFFLALTFGQYILFENACELQRVVFLLEEHCRLGLHQADVNKLLEIEKEIVREVARVINLT